MAATGFEGFEKRIELHFTGDDPLGLRALAHEALEQVLEAVQCSIVSAVGNEHFDSYVLSESSLFIYPSKVIIKTCGTTQLLKSIPSLLSFTGELGLELNWCKYTRGSFIFPQEQPFPHTSFDDEVMYLEQCLPANLLYRKARLLPPSTKKKFSHSHSWHVYVASADPEAALEDRLMTVEVCMTRLDCVLARQFYRSIYYPDDESRGHNTCNYDAAQAMTKITGIGSINPAAFICDYAFDPCGYSMNGLNQEFYSTIHVTPEDGFSYASFECVVADIDEITELLQKATAVFKAGNVSVSVTASAGQLQLPEDKKSVLKAVTKGVKLLGVTCRCRMMEEFPGDCAVTYQVFTARRNRQVMSFDGIVGKN